MSAKPTYEELKQRVAELEAAEAEWEKTETALQRSRNKYRALFETISDAVYVHDVNGRIIDFNQVACERLGYDREEMLRLHVGDIDVDHPTEAAIRQKIASAITSGPLTIESRHATKDGGVIEVELKINTFPLPDGALFVTVARDITDRKRAEEKLKRSEERLRTVLESMGDEVYVHDSLGRFLLVNDAACNNTGYQRNELLGMNVDDVVLQRRFFTKKERWPDLESNTPLCFESRHKRCDGSVYPVEITLTRLVMDDGKGFLALARDITKRKHAEMKLHEYSERLEEMVEERTQTLQKAQDELLVKERLAVLGHFAGSVAHELRNPLAVIDAAVYLLNMKFKPDEKIAPILERISRNIQKSTAIIESLLNLSRMEKPKTKSIDLADLIDQTLESVKPPVMVESNRMFHQKEIYVKVDIEQVRMAIKNIIQNAVQAMGATGELTITARRAPTGQVELSLADTGPGIAPEHLEKVFEPLFSTKTHGIGFGLSITKMIVENHGGAVRAQSEPGKGSAFILTLPGGKGGPKHEPTHENTDRG